MFPALISVGYISKPHGFKGALKWEMSTELLTDTNFPPFLWVYFDGKPVPHRIVRIQLLETNKSLLEFTDIETEQAAKNYQNKEIFCEQSIFEKYFVAAENANRIIGFRVMDATHGNIGIVEDIMPHTVQPTLVIKQGDIEILIPYTEAIVQEINWKLSEIRVDAPEGLIEMYLES